MYRFESAGGHGIYLPDLKLSLDNSHERANWVFVSHAHADHLPRNRSTRALATRPTHQCMRLRGFKGECMEIGYGERTEFDSFAITLYPAGHILGSAMILIESDSGRLLYTGDTKTPASPATEGFELPKVPVDELIIEATFGLPIYKWKPIDELQSDMQAFALNALEDGATPIFLGYNLGKAQEILHLLAPLGLSMQIHGAGHPYCQIYQENGIELGDVSAYDRSTCEGKILVAPSSALGSGFASHVRQKKVAYCSGWAQTESRRIQLNVDAGFALSDHLDFFELLDVCRNLSPKKIHITHTPNPAVVEHFLEKEGLSASFLDLLPQAEESFESDSNRKALDGKVEDSRGAKTSSEGTNG